MVRLKIRPKRDAGTAPCAAPLTALLACFATTGDLRASEQCAAAAKALHGCMAVTQRGGAARGGSSINHLLGKIK